MRHDEPVAFASAGIGALGGALGHSIAADGRAPPCGRRRGGVCGLTASSVSLRRLPIGNVVERRSTRPRSRDLVGVDRTQPAQWMAARREESGLLGQERKGAPQDSVNNSSPSNLPNGARRTSYVQSFDRNTSGTIFDTDEEEPRIRGRKRRKPKKGRNSKTVPFKTFEQELREEALLKHSEEIELAHDIQLLVKAETAKDALAKNLNRPPTMTEWADDLDISSTDLQRRIQVGLVSKKRLVKANLRLVNDMVNKSRFPASMVNSQDLVQEGCLGLVRAAEKFDGTKGFRFSTYATWWVRANIIRGIDSNSRLIKVPVRVKETFNKIKNTRNELSKTLQREPTEEEVAKAMKMTVAKTRLVIETYRHRATSLDEVTNNPTGEDSFNRTLGDSLTDKGDIEASIVEKHLRKDLDRVLKEYLKPRERVALRLRFGLENGQPLALREVGVLMELSTERVRQITRQAMGKLRDPSVQKALQEYLVE